MAKYFGKSGKIYFKQDKIETNLAAGDLLSDAAGKPIGIVAETGTDYTKVQISGLANLSYNEWQTLYSSPPHWTSASEKAKFSWADTMSSASYIGTKLDNLYSSGENMLEHRTLPTHNHNTDLVLTWRYRYGLEAR